MLNNNKIALISLGCDKNTVDSEVMLARLRDRGAAFTDDEEEADVIIINTCGFIMSAVEESVATIAQAAQAGKGAKIIVTGCAVNRYKNDLLEEMPVIDAIVGVRDYANIAIVAERVLGGERGFAVIDQPVENTKLERVVSTPSHYAYLKIAEGCDNCCAYCAIPSIKGRYVSRKVDELVDEARALAENGVKEIIIIAQDTALYGADIYGERRLHVLLRELSNIAGVEWLRVLYCYPEHIYPAFIDEMAANPKVAKYIDMPIQHADDEILKAMGRKSTRAGLVDIINELRGKVPNIAIRTTLIAGLPGESKKAYQNLLAFVKGARFDKLGVFAYSREKGTPAYGFEGQVGERTKAARRDALMAAQADIAAEKGLNKVGRTLKVIIDSPAPFEKNVWVGRTEGDCPEVDGVVFVRSETPLETGSFVNVRIEESDEYDLIGRI